jgi:mannosyltransferase
LAEGRQPPVRLLCKRAAPWVIGFGLLAALLRFPTLGVQSFWGDEGYTVNLMQLDFLQMLKTVPETESTPPLYYILAWVWSRLFGNAEFGLRSLSALLGTATIPVFYEAGAALISKRAGLVVAACVAVNPLMIWYSQEARAYALFAFLSGLSFLFFVRAFDEGDRRALWWWALSSALALTTHYFAVFLVAAEALWLLIKRGRRREVAVATGAVVAVGFSLLPLALHQRGKHFGFTEFPLQTRIAQIPEQFLVGYGIWSEPAGKVAATFAALIVFLAISLLLWRARSREKRRTLVAAFVASVGIGVPILLATLGLDYVLTLYFIGAILPCTLIVGGGLATSRLGLAAAGAYCVLAVAITAVVFTRHQFQRENLRGVAQALGPPVVDRALVVTPPSVLSAYMSGLEEFPTNGAFVREVAVVGLATKAVGEAPVMPRQPGRSTLATGFSRVEQTNGDRFRLIRFRSPTATLLRPAELFPIHLGEWPANKVSLVFQPAPDG